MQIMGGSKVATLSLLLLNGEEKALKVPSAKSLVIASLDHFEEYGRPIFKGFGEDLE